MAKAWEQLSQAERDVLFVLVSDALALAAVGRLAPGMREVKSGMAALGSGELPAPWQSERVSALGGGFLLSGLIHAWDFDDTHDEAVVHCMAVSFPSALYSTLQSGGSGLDLMNGIVTGVHAHVRLAQKVGARHGVVRTAGLGGIAAAAAAAASMRHADIENAASLALPTALSPTSRQAVADSSLLKRIQPGYAVQAGLTAAHMSEGGLVGPRNWLTGPFGILAGEQESFDALMAGEWAGADVSVKPFPSCRYNHEAVAAALRIVPELTAAGGPEAVDAVEEVQVRVPAGSGYALVAREFGNRGEPIIDAQFSLPWQIASTLLTGASDVTSLMEGNLSDRRIAELAGRVTVVQDLPEMVGMGAAHVRVTTSAGRELSEISESSEPTRVTWSDCRQKYVDCMNVAVNGRYTADDLFRDVQRIPEMTAHELDEYVSGLPSTHQSKNS